MPGFSFGRIGRMRTHVIFACAVALSLGGLAGCTDPAMRNQIDRRAEEARRGLDLASRPSVPQKRYNPLVVSDKVWVGNKSTRMHRGMPLPAKYESPRGVAVVSSDPLGLAEIAAAISQQTGIPVHVGDSGSKSAAPLLSSGDGKSGAGGPAMPLAYEGPLSGLLERVAGYFGVNWRYDGSTIAITRFETRVFQIEALPGTQQVQDGMQDDTSTSGGSSSSGSSSSSQQSSITQNSKFTIDLKYWDELGQIINAMLAGTGSVVISPSVGTVTVSTSPQVMRNVASYIAAENQRLSRQIAINVEVYAVSLSEGMDFSLAFNAALKKITELSTIYSGASAPTSISGFTGGGSMSVAILNTNDSMLPLNSVFTALNGIGDTTKIAKFPLVTLNNRPVSRRIGKDINYVAQTTTNTTGSGASSAYAGTTLTPGTVHQGFTVQLTPRLLDDGRILLQYSLNIIDLLSMISFNSVCGTNSSCSSSTSAAGSSSIQLPTTANRLFVQQSVLKSGSTLVIGGVDEEDMTQNSQGIGDPFNYALGGGNSSSKSHTMMFFAITPQVLDTVHTERD